MTINQVITLALPILALLASQAIRQNHWANWLNVLVAALTILVASLATLFIKGKLTGNIWGDVLLVFAASTALQTDGIAPLQDYLRANLLNLSKAVPPQPEPPAIPQPASKG